MTWTWRMEAVDGSTLDAPDSPPHPDQAAAESWLGEEFRELAEAGVAQVTLFEDDRPVYGPMSLSES